MSYTPPSGTFTVELSSTTAYTPPSSTSIVVDLAVEEGGFSGVTSFISVSGGVGLLGYAPGRAVVSHSIPSQALTLLAYTPTYAKTRHSSLGVSASLTVTAQAIAKVSARNTVGTQALTLTAHQPTYFNGQTQVIVQQASMVLASGGPVSTSNRVTALLPVASVAVTPHAPALKATTAVKSAASLSLSGYAPVAFPHFLHVGVVSGYEMPTVTIDDCGVLGITGLPVTQLFRIRHAVEAPSGLMVHVTGAIVGAYTDRVYSAIESAYKISGVVGASMEAKYLLKPTDRVLVSLVSPYRLPLVVGVEARYSLPEAIRVFNEVAAKYSGTVPVSASITSIFSRTQPVAAVSEARYTLDEHDRTTTAMSGVYSMPDAQVIAITTPPYVLYKGRVLRIEEAEVSGDEGDYEWRCSVVLSDLSDYMLLRQDQPFSVVIGDEEYKFIVDGKELDRNAPANMGMKLSGVSPSAIYASPRCLSASYSWETNELASTIAKELLPGLVWNTVDWVIPAYRFSVQDSTPIEAVKTLAEAVGAVLESDIDGSLHVRSLYPVSVPKYDTSVVAHTFLERPDILSVLESYVSADRFNRLVVTDVETSIADSLEWIEDYAGAVTGTVRAYLYPWRSAVHLTHTGVPSVYLGTPSTVITEHEEILEVYQGQGSAEYPIYQVVSVEYEAANVGSLVFDPDSRSFTVGGPSFNSVIRLVYRSRSLDYRAALPEGRPTQFLLESEPI